MPPNSGTDSLVLSIRFFFWHRSASPEARGDQTLGFYDAGRASNEIGRLAGRRLLFDSDE
jgi:hypothetical protein